MRFLVDAQLPPALARFLEAHAYEAKAARDVGLREADDPAIWSFAQAGAWTVVTKDEDFAERVLRSQTGPQVLWLRIGNSTNRVPPTSASSPSAVTVIGANDAFTRLTIAHNVVGMQPVDHEAAANGE